MNVRVSAGQWIVHGVVGSLLLAILLSAVQVTPSGGQTRLTVVFVVSGDTERLVSGGQTLARMIEVSTGFTVQTLIVTRYAAAVEAMCAGRAQMGWLNPFGYVLAHNKCGVEVKLVALRFGLPYYRSQFNATADSGISRIQDLRGKRFAFVDPVSTSGYLFAAAFLKKRGYDPDRFFGQAVFAGSHPAVILAIYRGQVDGGATFEDARNLVLTQFPDVLDRVRVIGYSTPIPSDTVSVTKDLPSSVKDKLQRAVLGIARTGPGKETLRTQYGVEGLTDVVEFTRQQFADLGVSLPQEIVQRLEHRGDRLVIPLGDWFYDPVREAATLLGLDLEKLAR